MVYPRTVSNDSSQLYAFPRNLVLAASAGTGKTHALVGVVVHLLITDRGGRRRGPTDPARIVATTFSRKAAAEIRARVTQELERLGNAPATSPYAPSLREASLLADDAIAHRARHALARISAARFGTLHSFATGIVRAYAVELGIGPRFELSTEADWRARADDAIARALELRLASSPSAVRSLTDSAGGIDRLLVQLRRVLVQLEEDGRAARELVVSTADAQLLEAQFARLVQHARSLTVVPRFEDAAAEVLRACDARDEERLENAVTALCSIAATGKKTPEVESFAIFRKELTGATNDDKGRRLARAYLFRGQFVEHARLARDVLAEAEVEIERLGRARASLGFGEVLRAARELLRARPDVADEVGAGMDALLVDEFQDTSRVQRDLLQLLWATPGSREPGRTPPLSAVRPAGLLVVGDRKQSIYGFRGADVGVFAELAVGLAGAPAREALGIPAGVAWEPREPLADFQALRHNRRSVPEILAFANAFSARRLRPEEPPAELYEIEYVAATEDLLVPPERTDALSADTRTRWLRVQSKRSTSSRLEEALVIAEQIAAVLRRGEPLVGRDRRRPAFKDIAVLATTNGMIDAVAFALAQADLPYVVAGKSFFRTREVRDLAAMLALVLDPSDRLAMLEVLRGPWAAVHDETLLGLTGSDGLVSPYAWTSPPRPELVHEEDRPRLAELSAVVVELARVAGRIGPASVLREAVRTRRLAEVLGSLPRGEQRVANIRKLLAIADRHSDVRAFRRWLDEASEQELAESEAATFSESDDAVRLLTVHASKGLDFPIVFVPEIGAALPAGEKGAVRVTLGSGDAPNVLSIRAADARGLVLEPPSFLGAYTTARRRERAERQRLAYVAVTRAADALFLVGGRSREGTGDPAASSLAVLEDLASSPAVLRASSLDVEQVAVPAPTIRRHEAPVATAAEDAPRAARRDAPAWRSLPIAPTALADFDHCPRRFELVHILGLPERLRGRRAETGPSTTGSLDARAQGTLAHAVLERVPASAFSGVGAREEASRALAAEGVAADHPQHEAIVERVAKFLRGQYATQVAEQHAELRREVAFVLSVQDEHDRALVLRGSIDLVVSWPDGSMDIIDYKSARGGGPDAYAFQLDVYTLAARAAFPAASRLRAGLVFLGSASGEPSWRALPDEGGVRRHLAKLGGALVEARWNETFPRVSLDRCEAIYCGFIGRCHGASPARNGTDAKPPRATTT